MEEKIKQKRGGCGVGDTMKIAWDVGSVNGEKNFCDEMENFQCCCSVNGREAGRVDSNARRELRSSRSLRVDAIQAIDIFIRGCYL